MRLKHRGELREILAIFGDLPPRWLLHGARRILASNVNRYENGKKILFALNRLEKKYKSMDKRFSQTKGVRLEGRASCVSKKNSSRK